MSSLSTPTASESSKTHPATRINGVPHADAPSTRSLRRPDAGRAVVEPWRRDDVTSDQLIRSCGDRILPRSAAPIARAGASPLGMGGLSVDPSLGVGCAVSWLWTMPCAGIMAEQQLSCDRMLAGGVLRSACASRPLMLVLDGAFSRERALTSCSRMTMLWTTSAQLAQI